MQLTDRGVAYTDSDSAPQLTTIIPLMAQSVDDVLSFSSPFHMQIIHVYTPTGGVVEVLLTGFTKPPIVIVTRLDGGTHPDLPFYVSGVTKDYVRIGGARGGGSSRAAGACKVWAIQMTEESAEG